MLDMASSTDVSELPLQLASRYIDTAPDVRWGDFLGSGGCLRGLDVWLAPPLLGFFPFTPSTQKLGFRLPDDAQGGGEAGRAGCKLRR
jgi:hypothetical protein|tara:strand:- start:284 stop:547 length:264 start_codon:yes stop_codon:yes gene_type:complete